MRSALVDDRWFNALDRIFDWPIGSTASHFHHPTSIATCKTPSYRSITDGGFALYKDDKDSCVVEVAMPGIEPEDVIVKLKGDTIHIEGKRSGREKQIVAFEKDIFVGYEDLNLDEISTTYKNGLLRMTIATAKPKSTNERVLWGAEEK